MSWLLQRLGIDRAIGFTILARGWASAAGLVTVALIARFLSPAEQGYYYTFGSLIALQIVFELGFSLVILQMASHERAHLEISWDGAITGNPVSHARLASVLQKTVRWYTAAAVFLAVFLITAGTHFFAAHQHPSQVAAWRAPWYVAAIAATFTFQLDPILSFMEGCGFLANVARLRFAQAITGSILAWLALVSHHGLFAPGMVIIGNAGVAFLWLVRRRRLLFSLLWHEIGEHRIAWMREVWPFQWRIAVSWLCGYFIFQLYNSVLFAFRGAVEAGQMGMSLSLTGALLSIAVSWINTKAAPFGAMIARKEYMQLDRLFFLSLKQAFAVCAFGALSVWIIDFYLNRGHLSFAHRLLQPASLAMVLATAPINVVVFAQATYLRAHKEEKFLLNSVLGAVLVGLGSSGRCLLFWVLRRCSMAQGKKPWTVRFRIAFPIGLCAPNSPRQSLSGLIRIPRKCHGRRRTRNPRYWIFLHPVLRLPLPLASGWVTAGKALNRMDRLLGYPISR